MSIEDFLISGLLCLSIVRQLRGRRLTWVSLAWPIGLVGYAAVRYLRTVPATGPDLAFVGALATLGLAIGVSCGLLSRVWAEGTVVMTRATGLAAGLWVAGIGSRIAIGLWAEHGGAASLAAISAHLGVTSFAAWSSGLLLMSLAEVAGRTASLVPRLIRARGASAPVAIARP